MGATSPNSNSFLACHWRRSCDNAATSRRTAKASQTFHRLAVNPKLLGSVAQLEVEEWAEAESLRLTSRIGKENASSPSSPGTGACGRKDGRMSNFVTRSRRVSKTKRGGEQDRHGSAAAFTIVGFGVHKSLPTYCWPLPMTRGPAIASSLERREVLRSLASSPATVLSGSSRCPLSRLVTFSGLNCRPTHSQAPTVTTVA